MRDRWWAEGLGVVAVVMAIVALTQVGGMRRQAEQNECRDRLDAAVVVEFGRAFDRLEQAFAAMARGDEHGTARAVQVSPEDQRAFDLALTRREHAVALCG